MEKREWLVFLKSRWGLPAFFNVIFISGLVTYLVLNSPVVYREFLGRPMAFTLALFSSVAMYVICYSSYSRIFKFKVFVLGHLFFATGLIYLYLTHFAYDNPQSAFSPAFLASLKETVALRIILGIMSLNLILTAVMPVKLRYRMTQFIAVLLVLFETALCFTVMVNASASAAASALLHGVGYLSALALINGAVVLLTLMTAKEENSFGGVISGLALLNVFMAYCVETDNLLLARFLFFLEPLIILAAVVLYWFRCLHHRVSYDPLLQIYNRDYAHSIIAGTSRVGLGRPYAIAMVDIDRFKGVNDTYGHQVGDEVLHGTAQCIRTHAMPSGITCRYGGEEIIVFFKNCGRDEAFVICETIRRNVRKLKYQAAGREFSVSVSIGIADCDDPELPMDRIVKAADEAVYTAKETGRNRVVVGALKKRVHDPLRRTYLAMKAMGRDRRKPDA
jgi:diguanylate cyclase (GGDEF)-like protein